MNRRQNDLMTPYKEVYEKKEWEVILMLCHSKIIISTNYIIIYHMDRLKDMMNNMSLDKARKILIKILLYLWYLE